MGGINESIRKWKGDLQSQRLSAIDRWDALEKAARLSYNHPSGYSHIVNPFVYRLASLTTKASKPIALSINDFFPLSPDKPKKNKPSPTHSISPSPSSNPHFAKLHLSKSSTAILIEDGCFRSKELLSTQFVEEVHNRTLDVEKMRFVSNTNLPDTEFHFINSCNGLLCLYGKSKGDFNQMIYVCNPILGEYIIIPVLHKLRKYGHRFALGFSSVSNQYKALQTIFPEGEYVRQVRAEVYTVGTGRWRSMGNAPFNLGHLDANAFVHDSVHWIDCTLENDGFICAFDFGFEQFKRLSLPPSSQILEGSRIHSIACVGVLKAWLFVAFEVYSECGDIEIWVMEEYGVKESWSKKFVVVTLQLDDYLGNALK
ncbi:unnamed protein product [Dovyalis caffra]|uniref:F-box associated beta-propeller type 1 domain-containing protein n=1 Tax=Dovyalis caffra TaxID=77055 RepID=A0AAV1RP16_9ROSI|nr:unnamed protein product [Dovyalis caffra]